MAVFAVIVGYKNPQLTVAAARSLAAQTADVNVCVWNNFSTSQDHDALAALSTGYATQWPAMGTTVYSEENLLWAPAVNAAVRLFANDAEFILMCNNDVVLPPNTVARLLDVFRAHPDAGLVGPCVTALGGPQDPIRAQRQHLPFRVAFILGACAMVRRSVWDEIGPLDEDMPLGADDHDYSLRVKHAGYSIWVEPHVTVQHKGHASDGPEWDEWGSKSWGAFNTKWEGYFISDEEATKCHWGQDYWPGFEIGTGWTAEEYNERVGP